MKEYAFGWDWKATPPFKKIIDAAIEMQQQGLPIEIYVIDTGSDDEGLLLTTNKYNKSELKEVWMDLFYGV
jgi:hypothetical protein